jgi:AcrR family transcriptional regulator
VSATVVRQGSGIVRRQARREETILEAAHTLMLEKGYAAMTMDDLAARAGLTKPTLYRYFSSKETIAVQALVRLIRRGREYLAQIDPHLPAIERIEQTIRWVLHARYIEGHGMFGAAREGLNPMIRSHPDYQHEVRLLLEIFTGMIEDGKKEGSVAPNLVTRAAAQVVFSIVRDWEYDYLLLSGQWDHDAFLETLAVVLLNGLRIQEGRSTVS